MEKELSFKSLANSIKIINDKAGSSAKSAINQLMTMRNWAIGYYIVEYEQDGKDRAEYGSNLLNNLEKQIDVKGMNATLFKWCRQFYISYPQIGATVLHQFELPEIKKSATVSHEFVMDAEKLINGLSFSHIREIMVIKDPFERFFYETECMKCGWSVRELRRQIKTNLFVRAGISKNPELLLKQTVSTKEQNSLTIRDPFTFEFLGLEAKEAVSESDLEQALMDHLQEFLLELGDGFCFEARQKRIIIDDKLHAAGLTSTKSENVDAPIINEFPICFECEFIEYQDNAYGLGVIGKVVNVTADESVINGENVDIDAVEAIAFDPYTHGYYKVGGRVGDAFKDGLKLKAMDSK